MAVYGGGAKDMKDDLINGIRVKCYELPGDGFDRWTAIFPHTRGQSDSRLDTCDCVGMSGHSSGVIGRHLGRRVPFEKLPDNLRATVRADCAEYANAKKIPVKRSA